MPSMILSSVARLVIGCAILQASVAAAAEPASTVKSPNIVIVLADDLGWGDLACYGHPIIKTPHLDKFAMQGTRLTQCYSASGVCSPSRSAIMTGRTPYRNGVFTWIPEGSPVHLRTSEITIAKLLRDRGYETCHSGKWHLNGMFNDSRQPQPSDHGYSWWLATQNNAAPSHENPKNFVRNGEPVGPMTGFSAPLVADEAITWLKTKRDGTKPFFLAVWTHEPHYPIKSANEFKSLYSELSDPVQVEHHANVTQLDSAFGKVMAALDELKLADDTFVVFTADNGPEGDGIKSPGRGSTGGLRGRKRAVYEGGIRVPGIVRWPGHVKAGATSDVPVIGSDWFATFAALTNTPAPNDRVIDGGDMLPSLSGKPIVRSRPLYWRCDIAPGDMKTAMRIGDWKIVADEPLTKFELYDIVRDPQEKQDLAATNPMKLAELKAELVKLNTEIEAEGPTWWKGYGKKKGQPKPAAKKNSAGGR
jgi:arylsulfatase A